MRKAHQEIYLQAFSDYLKEKGKSLTQERVSILKAVLAKRSHFEAEEIVDELKSGENRVSRASVYRTLKLLEEIELIEAIQGLKEQTQYEPKFLKHHHDHLLCEGCGKIIEFRSDKIEGLQKAICEQKKFHSSHHILQIFGLCENCYPGKLR